MDFAYVSYTYDAWGNVISITGELASTVGQINPFRYRGYYYDNETGLYYLNSRYYDAEVGRFISADSVMASVSPSLDGNNLFAYCFNNPVNMVDNDGRWPEWVENLYNDAKEVATQTVAAVTEAVEEVLKSTCDVVGDVVNAAKDTYDFFTNTDEQKVLEAKNFAFYYGVPVFKSDKMKKAGLSFGVIVLGNSNIYNEAGIKTLRHEYGHVLHMRDIGVETYIHTVAIPSLISAALVELDILPYKYYHSLPTERIADIYGGVKHKVLPMSNEIASVYWGLTILTAETKEYLP